MQVEVAACCGCRSWPSKSAARSTGRRRDDVDDAAEGVVAPRAGAAAPHDLHLLDALQRHAVPVHPAAERIVDAARRRASTSARLVPLGPMPRSDRPWVVGCPTRLDVRRKRLKPGTWRRRSSRVWLGESVDVLAREHRHVGGRLVGAAARVRVTVTTTGSRRTARVRPARRRGAPRAGSRRRETSDAARRARLGAALGGRGDAGTGFRVEVARSASMLHGQGRLTRPKDATYRPPTRRARLEPASAGSLLTEARQSSRRRLIMRRIPSRALALIARGRSSSASGSSPPPASAAGAAALEAGAARRHGQLAARADRPAAVAEGARARSPSPRSSCRPASRRSCGRTGSTMPAP